jgi:hypothetical protein
MVVISTHVQCIAAGCTTSMTQQQYSSQQDKCCSTAIHSAQGHV